MTADELLAETTKRIHGGDDRTPEQAMFAFVAAEVLEYDGETGVPDHAYVDHWLRIVVGGASEEEAAEMYADLVECLARFLA